MQRIVIIALFIGICNVTSIIAVIKSTITTGTYPRLLLSDFFDHDKDLVSSPQVYGSCLGKFYGSESSCSLTLAPRRPTDTPNRSFTCDFQVPLPNDTDQYNPAYRRAATITKVKALLVLSQGCIHSFYILNFSNCKATPVEYNNKTSIRACHWGFLTFVPHRSLYDIIIDGSSRIMFRRVLYYDIEDNKEIIVRDIFDWFPANMAYDMKAFLYTPTRGRLFAVLKEKFEGDILTIRTINDDGSNHTVRQYVLPPCHSWHGILRTSAMNEMLSIGIQKNETTIQCAQFDSDGHLMFEIPALQHVNKYTNKSLTLIGIHNLPGGGLNLITTDNESKPGVTILTKIDRKGKIIASLKIPNFTCDLSPYIHYFIKDKTGEHCFSQLCSGYATEYKQIELQTVCFEEEDYNDKKLTTHPSCDCSCDNR